MGIDPVQALFDEDGRLEVGSDVVAYWTSNGYYYRALARVTALTARRVEVRLLEATQSGRYRVGDLVELPRVTDSAAWSSETCVRAVRVSGLCA